LILASACGEDAPTGVKEADLRGTWSGTFTGVTLLGRTLSGDVEWVFSSKTFEIHFFNAPEGQAERIGGNWKFANERLVLELKTSFPIDTDIGAVDSLFVSILSQEMSAKTVAGSDIRLFKTQSAFRTDFRKTYACRSTAPHLPAPFVSTFPRTHNARPSFPDLKKASPWKPGYWTG
ncbi:MAG: hypothetical protein O2954_15320, partial [bacterium]|nr:hypothetical protein [bacterium]